MFVVMDNTGMLRVGQLHRLPASSPIRPGQDIVISELLDDYRVRISWETDQQQRTDLIVPASMIVRRPDHANYRPTDPHTSRTAARRSQAAAQRTAVLNCHAQYRDGLCDWEVTAMTDIWAASVSKRRGELRDAGLLRETNRTRLSPRNRPAIVWQITTLGIDQSC